MPQQRYLDVSSAEHNVIHLINGKKGRFWNIILNESESFVLICEMIKRQVDALHRAKRQECLFHGVLADVEVYAADVDPTNP